MRKAINRAAKPYDPGPAYISYGPYTMTKDGLTVEGKASGGAPIRISAPFEVLGESRNPGSLEWGKMLRFLDGDGKLHDLVVPNALMQGEPAILCSLLASEGLAIHPDHKKHLLSYVAGVQSKRRVTVVMRTGWHEIEGRKYFVLKDETIGPKGAELVVLDASAVGPYETKGSLEDWKAGVGRMVADHFLPMLLVSTALTGPLLDLVGQDGGGIHVLRRVVNRQDHDTPGRCVALGPWVVRWRLRPGVERDPKRTGGCGRLRQRHCPRPRRAEHPGRSRSRPRDLRAREREWKIADGAGHFATRDQDLAPVGSVERRGGDGDQGRGG